MNHPGARKLIVGCGLAGLLLVGLAGGCRLARPGGPFASGPQAPALLGPTATPAEIVAAVNQNSSRVQTYTAPNASFAIPGLPGLPLLRGSIVLERPRRFRLRAGTALSGGEVDLGSNDDLFWLWAKRNEPPAVYFARHDQHAVGAARNLLPIEPSWVIDSLGLVTLDPLASYQGPFPRPDGTLELRSAALGPAGPLERVTVVDPSRAWVVEQHVYNQSGALVASAVAEDFRFHPASQVSLPERVTIRAPTADLALTINTGTVSVNTPIANPTSHWSLPYLEGYPQVDLGRSDALPGFAPPAAPINASHPAAPAVNALPGVAVSSLPAGAPLLSTPVTSATTGGMQRIPAGGVSLPAAGIR